MLTLMFWCSPLNWSTILRMNWPSPPVKPFQKARLTLGPLYSAPLPNRSSVAWPPAPGGVLLPPQAASSTPAPAPTPSPRNWRRLSPPRLLLRSVPMSPPFSPRSGRRWLWLVDAEVVELGHGPGPAVGDQPDPGAGAGREGPDPTPGPVAAVAAGGGPELVLAVGRVDPVAEPQPGDRGRGADGHAAVGGAVGERLLLAELGLAGVPDGHVREAQEVVVVDVDGQAGLLEVADLVGAEVDGQLGLDRVGATWGVAQQQGGVVAGPDQVGGLGRPAQHAAGLGRRRVGPDPGPAVAADGAVGELVAVDDRADPGRWDLVVDRVVEPGRAQVGRLGRAAAGGRPDPPGPAGAGRQGPAHDRHRVVEAGLGDLDRQLTATQLGGDVVPGVVAEPGRQRAGLADHRLAAVDHLDDQGPGLAVEPADQVVALAAPAGDQAGGLGPIAEPQVGLGPVVGRRPAGGDVDQRLAARRGPGQVDVAADRPVGHRGPLRPLGRPAAGPDRGPAVDPVQAVEQHRPLVDAERLVQERVAAIDGVVDEPVLAGQVGGDGVVAGPDPGVAVGGDHDGPAD